MRERRHRLEEALDGGSLKQPVIPVRLETDELGGRLHGMCETACMRIVAIMLSLASAVAVAQVPADKAASDAENSAVEAIVRCMVSGLPEDWQQAMMEINLDKPLDETGAVRYRVQRGPDTEPDPFTP